MPEPNSEIVTYVAWKNWRPESFAKFRSADARYFGWLLQNCVGIEIKQVLELGFGNGEFLGYTRSIGLSVCGIETLPALIERAHAAGIPALASTSELPSEASFELIAAFDVMEHIEQDSLIEVLNDLATHLSPGGYILCRVPNGESPMGRMHQHGDMTHRTTLGVSKFKQIGAALGLQVLCLGEAPWHRMQHAGRSPKNVARAMLRWLISHLLAFAYHWDASALAPNVLVQMRKPSNQIHPTPTPTPTPTVDS